jgi:hypothetical protein
MRRFTQIAECAVGLFAGGCSAVLLTVVVVVLVFGQKTASFWLYWAQIATAIIAALAAFSVFRSQRAVSASRPRTIPTNLLFLPLFVTFVIAQVYLFVNLPSPQVCRLELRRDPVKSVELSMLSTQRVITTSNLCADVLQTIRTAQAGEMHPAPVLGRLTIHYSDGTNAVIEMLPGHRPNELDLVRQGIVFNISRSQMFAALKRCGLLSE